MNTVIPQLTLECVIRLEAAGLRVAYRVRNNSGAQVGLFNRIQSANLDGTASYAAENVYIDVDSGTLHLQKLALAVPAGLHMSARPIPAITLLDDQQVFTEEFTLTLPVAAQNPFRRAQLAMSQPGSAVQADKPEQATAIVLSVGAFQVDPTWRFTPVSPASPTIFQVWPPGPPVDRQVVLTCGDHLTQPVTVLNYRIVPAE
jgi:hypothetical protein